MYPAAHVGLAEIHPAAEVGAGGLSAGRHNVAAGREDAEKLALLEHVVTALQQCGQYFDFRELGQRPVAALRGGREVLDFHSDRPIGERAYTHLTEQLPHGGERSLGWGFAFVAFR